MKGGDQSPSDFSVHKDLRNDEVILKSHTFDFKLWTLDFGGLGLRILDYYEILTTRHYKSAFYLFENS